MQKIKIYTYRVCLYVYVYNVYKHGKSGDNPSGFAHTISVFSL